MISQQVMEFKMINQTFRKCILCSVWNIIVNNITKADTSSSYNVTKYIHNVDMKFICVKSLNNMH